jgi:hypothetical protein
MYRGECAFIAESEAMLQVWDRYKNEIIAGRFRRLLRHVGTESDVLQAGLDVLSEGGVVVKVGVFVPRQEVASPRYVPGEVFGETGAVTRLETEPSRRHQSPESVGFRRPRPSHRYSRVCRGADVYPEGLAPRLELVGDGDVVAEHAVPGHLHAHHPRQDGPRVQPYAHLQTPPFSSRTPFGRLTLIGCPWCVWWCEQVSIIFRAIQAICRAWVTVSLCSPPATQ